MTRLTHNPDWRREADYPPRAGTSMHRWAVEFLQRNSQFREAIKGIGALPGPRNDPLSPFGRRWREIADEFGIGYPMLTEWGGDTPVKFKGAPYHLHSDVEFKGARGKWFVGEDYGWGAAIVFDLRKPIAPQIRAAERMLKGTARAGVKALAGAQRDRRADYQAMLRVLDARAEGAKIAEIASALFPKKISASAIDHVKKLHKKAERLRDGDYRHLSSLASGGDAKKPSVISPG